MAPKDLPSLCKCTSSLDFPIALSIDQSNECCQTKNFYAAKEKLPVTITNEKLMGLGLVKLKDSLEPSAPLIQRFKLVYVYF